MVKKVQQQSRSKMLSQKFGS